MLDDRVGSFVPVACLKNNQKSTYSVLEQQRNTKARDIALLATLTNPMARRRLPSYWFYTNSCTERAYVDFGAFDFLLHHSANAQAYLANRTTCIVLLRFGRVVSLLLQPVCQSGSKLYSHWTCCRSLQMEPIFGSLPYWCPWRWTCWSLHDLGTERNGTDALLDFNAKPMEFLLQLCPLPNSLAFLVHDPVSHQLHAPCPQET